MAGMFEIHKINAVRNAGMFQVSNMKWDAAVITATKPGRLYIMSLVDLL